MDVIRAGRPARIADPSLTGQASPSGAESNLVPDTGLACDHDDGAVLYERSRYGTADIDDVGVKAAIDDEGPPLDPDADLPSTTRSEADVRAYLRGRFPTLEGAPFIGARSCRYEMTADTRLIGAPHPEHASVWIVGGGSGHGLKHGPPLAERLATAFASGTTLPADFSLGERSGSQSLRTASSSHAA
jgi:sarcosine oxidase